MRVEADTGDCFTDASSNEKLCKIHRWPVILHIHSRSAVNEYFLFEFLVNYKV